MVRLLKPGGIGALRDILASLIARTIKTRNRLDKISLLILCKARISWQRQRLMRGGFGVRQITAPVTKVSEALLQVQGDRIVDSCADASLGKECPKLVAPRCADHVLVINVPAVTLLDGEHDAALRQASLVRQVGVAFRIRAAGVGPC